MERRFIVDSMLGKFSRWLRILGMDAIYEDGTPDEELLKSALESGRVLLTSDRELYRKTLKRGAKAFLVEGEGETERLASFSKRFRVPLKISASKSRCVKCNSPVKPARKEEVMGKVPMNTFRIYRRFWMCSGCGQVYWKGGHWKRMSYVIRRASEIIGGAE